MTTCRLVGLSSTTRICDRQSPRRDVGLERRAAGFDRRAAAAAAALARARARAAVRAAARPISTAWACVLKKPTCRRAGSISSMPPELSRMTGIFFACGISRMASASSRPSMPGMTMSITAASNFSPACSSASASSPEAHAVTSMPQRWVCRARIERLVSLSSTTSRRRPCNVASIGSVAACAARRRTGARMVKRRSSRARLRS